MSFKNFIKKINAIADESENKILFDEKLSGVHIYEEKSVCKGYRLYNGILIDIYGKVIFNYDFKYLGVLHKDYYIAQQSYESSLWGFFDKRNNLIWEKTNTIHHDIFITEDKRIITFDKECKKYKRREVDFDTIVEYDFSGEKISEYSIYENLKEFQKYHNKLSLDFIKLPLLDFARRKDKSPWGGNYDYYHINSIQIIPENILGKKDKRFQKDNYLISFRHGSLIYILDKDTKKIVYSINQFSIKDEIQGQHGVQLLENGNILMFDNGRYRRWSRVIELNAISLEIEWEYRTEIFFSEAQGYVQKLKNGNILITISENGRVIEVTKDKKIVWEFYNPIVQSKLNSNFSKHFGEREWIYRMTHYDNY